MTAAAALAALLALRVGGAVSGPVEAGLVLAVLPPAWLTADLVGGAVHWWADRVASERLPWLGPHFVRPFREHHDDPLAILQHDFIETNGNTCIALLPLLGTALAGWPGGAATRGALAAASAVLWFCLATALTNQIHKWAHAPRPPRPLRWLQRAGLVLDPCHHALHHRPPHRGRYCITAGWSNPLLDRLGTFTTLERWLRGRAGTAGRAAP